MLINHDITKFGLAVWLLASYACDAAGDSNAKTTAGNEPSIYDIWFKVDATHDEDGMDLREKGYRKVTLCLNSKITTADIVVAEAEVDDKKNLIQLDFINPEAENPVPTVRVVADYDVDDEFLNLTNIKQWDFDSDGKIDTETLREGPATKYERKAPREACTVGG